LARASWLGPSIRFFLLMDTSLAARPRQPCSCQGFLQFCGAIVGEMDVNSNRYYFSNVTFQVPSSTVLPSPDRVV